MMPVQLQIALEYEGCGGRKLLYVRSGALVESIPEPDCEISLSIDGHSFSFSQSRQWPASTPECMRVTLFPIPGISLVELFDALRGSIDWKSLDPGLEVQWKMSLARA